MLHTVNKSPFEKNALESCLRFAKEGDAVLLLEDGIYAALQKTAFDAKMTQALNKQVKIYVLLPDVEARGMRAENVIAGIEPVDYGKFVDLVVENNTVQAWL
jgi:tRNA 2-thiouridine synthesizing protein B